MTRKNALKMAVLAVKSYDFDDRTKEEIIKKLNQCISDMPLNHWSRESIFDACQQYIEDNGRPIGLADFDRSPKLPSHTVVERKFNMPIREFRDTYFPLPAPDIPATPAALASYLNQFKSDFEESGARTREEYDKLRRGGAPCSAAVLRVTGFGSWHELLHRADVIIPDKPEDTRNYSISFTMQYWNELKKLDERIKA